VVHGEQSVRDGSTVKLRTTQEFRMYGGTVPKNTFVFGQVNIGDNRLNIKIDGIKVAETVFTNPMIVLDEDGGEGLKLVGGHGEGVSDKAIDVADYSTGNVLGGVPIVGSIAQGTKEIFRSRRANNSKPVILPSNYRLLIKRL
jgi:hypothetical protein